MGSQHTTPTRRLLDNWNNQWNNSQWSSRLWGTKDGKTVEQPISENSPTAVPSPSRSLPKSPTRTPVTENDPLGALVGEIEEGEEDAQSCEHEGSEESNNLSIDLDEDGNPILFGGRRTRNISEKGVARSATFHEEERGVPHAQDCDPNKEDPKKSKLMQRSSTITMPLDTQTESGGGGSVASSIGSLGSSFKLPFR